MHATDLLTDVDYPETDGKPIGETDLHRYWMKRIDDLLSYRYRGQRVYVSSDLLLYYTEGVPTEFVVPDDFVVLDHDPRMRRTYKLWEEKKAPNVVFEVTSRATRRQDGTAKPNIYSKMGVRELFLFDPTADYLRPPLRGFRLTPDGPLGIETDATGALPCHELGLLLKLEGKELMFRDAKTGQRLMTEGEAEREAREAEQEAREAAEVAMRAAERRAQQAEEEVQRLRAQLKGPPAA